MWGILGVGVASAAESPGLAVAMGESQLDNLVGDSSPSSRILIRIPKRIRKPPLNGTLKGTVPSSRQFRPSG